MTTDSQARAVPRPRAPLAPPSGGGPGGGLRDSQYGTDQYGTDQDRPDQDRREHDRREHDRAEQRAGSPRSTGARALEEAWERLGDALFTYCLSVLCDQDEALSAVREVRQLSVRHRRRLRRPELQRAWLYALARHVCLLRMEAEPIRVTPARMTGRHTAQHSRLARLSWPEAAGVAPTQREALELAGRHGLDTHELAAVLDLRPDQAGALLAQAVCELERTAAALAVLKAGDCPELARLGRERGTVLGAALRGELVRHVDDCPTCRGTAERAAAAGPWPGTFRAPGALRLVEAPAEAWQQEAAEGFFASLGAGRLGTSAGVRSEATSAAAEPRFDRRGFPLHRTVRSERATMLRQRAMTSSVIAMVVAAPVVAMWATHHGHAGSQAPVSPVSSVRVDTSAADNPSDARAPYGNGTALPPAGPRSAPTVQGHHGADLGLPGPGGAAAPAGSAVPPAAGPGPVAAAPGRLTVSAGEMGGRTVITLVNTGGTEVSWRATATARWLRLSRASGTLGPGERLTLLVTVDEAATPADPWSAQVTIGPSAGPSTAVVTLQGPGTGGGRRGVPPPTAPPSTAPPSTAPSPTDPAPSGSPTPSAHPTPTPTTPAGTPTAAPTPTTAVSPTDRGHRPAH